MANGNEREDVENRVDQTYASESGEIPSPAGSGGNSAGLAERLMDSLVEDGGGDLLLHQRNRDDRVLQWLRSLDSQVIGACRADERLRPLLKLNASSGVAEDRLLVHLSQHFDPAEVSLLARCFYMPLVSIRVGRIEKQGTLLCPTSTRGNLNLTLLPTSDMRLSFIGDDGHMERIVTLSNSDEKVPTIEEIQQDVSGRSFLIKIPDGRVFFFWCSEKSNLLGNELIGKVSRDPFNI
ncbi:hypothetical protein SAY87_001153 [Trapa incisa]|uniref:Uncharacterized protein n=1 Tax=Trapa incisa TaxID=236973 RepID=A0AAN7JH36_9MYRT|nr:hypothetical protein SAY87_001153 [Trapa incisa]